MCGLSERETFQVAYITMRGWELCGDVWTKPGHTRKIEKSHPCGCCSYEEETDQYDAEQAFNEQWGTDP